MKITRKTRTMAIAVIIALLAQLAIVYMPKQQSAGQASTDQDKQVAAELSNLTGETAENILKIKQTGLSWNEVSERLKDSEIDTVQDGAERESLLNETGIGAELLDQLHGQGYTDEEIMDAKLLAERIMLQLQQLQNNETVVTAPKPAAVSDTAGNAEFQAAVTKIGGKFAEGEAVSLLLALKKEFGTLDAVMDEYLLALQFDLDLATYLSDKEAYLKSKDEQTAGVQDAEVVTMELLEQAILEQLQPEPAQSAADTEDIAGKALASEAENTDSPLPEIKPPVPGDVIPQNPAEAVRQEIEAINPNRR
jgi:hypothetical protein